MFETSWSVEAMVVLQETSAGLKEGGVPRDGYGYKARQLGLC